MRSEEELVRLGVGPGRAVAGGAVAAVDVHGRDAFVVVFWGREGDGGVGEVEGVLDFAGGVLLRDEEGVEAPEAGFDEGGRGHFGEAGWREMSGWSEWMDGGGGSYPISRKMLRISSRTLRSGWRAPPFGVMPSASKLYFLNVDVFHFPLWRLS